MCATSAAAAVRRKYGKYLPHQRANVDQVPLPFVNDMESTYEQVGEKRVAINQNGPALAKYEKHLQLQPAPCIIFRGTGARISDTEKAASGRRRHVQAQPDPRRLRRRRPLGAARADRLRGALVWLWVRVS